MSAPNQLGEAPVRSLFFRYYGPALIGILSSTVHQVINGIILGQQVGKEGLAAVGLYGPVLIVFVSLALPVMIGGGVMIGKSFGAGDTAKAQTIFQFATTLVLMTGGLIAASAPFLHQPLARFLAGEANPGLIQNTAGYTFWQLLSLPFFFLGMIWGNFVRADGAPTVSRNASLLAVAVNIVLDLVLIIGLDMGVEGAAIATGIALASGPAYLFVYMLRGKTRYSLTGFRFTLRLAEWKELLRIGIPSFASELAFSTGLLLINRTLVGYGPLAVSAFGLVNYLSFILIRLFTAAMIASMPIMSFNLGARQPARVLETLRFAISFTVVLGMVITLTGFLIPDLLITLFSGDQTAAFRGVATQAMRLYFLLFLAAGPNYLLAAYFQSTGKSTASTLINLLKGIVLIGGFLLVLPDQLGLPGVWLSRSLAEIGTLVFVGGYTLYQRQQYFSEAALARQAV